MKKQCGVGELVIGSWRRRCVVAVRLSGCATLDRAYQAGGDVDQRADGACVHEHGGGDEHGAAGGGADERRVRDERGERGGVGVCDAGAGGDELGD